MRARKRHGLVGISFLFAIVLLSMAVSGCGKKPAPSISSVSPSSGQVGTEVTISGSDFGATQSNSTVNFGSASATAVSWSDSEIEAEVPEELDAGENDVSVTTAGGTSETATFEVTKEKNESQDGDQAAKNTPEEAIVEFLKKQGENPEGSTFAEYKVSKQDPNWVIYSETSHPGPPVDLPMFLLHEVNGEWTVLTWGTDIFPQEYGGPSDLAL
jgi:IPT/TIG domain